MRFPRGSSYHSKIRTPSAPGRRLCEVFLLLGAALRLIQYLGRPSFWIDELALARNIAAFPPAALMTGPLAFQQSAPPGFLALEKLMAAIFGAGELSLRFVPLLASLASLILFERLLRACRLTPPAIVGGCALFALVPGLTFYGTELKQYSTDMLFSLLLAVLALRDLEAKRFPGMVLIAAATAAPWFSNQAIFVVAALAVAILASVPSQEVRRRLAAVSSAAVLAASAAGAVFAARSALPPETRAYFRRFWFDGFPPHPVSAAASGIWAVGALAGFVRNFLEVPYPAVWLILAAAGAWALRANPRALALLIGPAALALAAAFAGLYPFAHRALAFFAPGFLAAVAASATVLDRSRIPAKRAAAFGLALAPVVLAAGALGARHPVVDMEPTRRVVEELAKRRKPSEPVYVYYGARQAFAFYGARSGLTAGPVVFGGCHRSSPSDYLPELDPLRGHGRAWVFIAHDLDVLNERALLIGYLKTIGIELWEIRVRGASRGGSPELLLFDLTADLRPETPAGEYPVPALSKASASLANRFGCEGPVAFDPRLPP